MASLLSDYLERAARERSSNCLTFAADWIKLATGCDPAHQWRDLVQADLEKLHAEHRARTVLAARAMRRLGFKLTDDPVPGDVALVRAAVPVPHIVSAICAHENQWAVRASDFALVVTGPPALCPLLIWHVEWSRQSASH